jgi:hypothetical protein
MNSKSNNIDWYSLLLAQHQQQNSFINNDESQTSVPSLISIQAQQQQQQQQQHQQQQSHYTQQQEQQQSNESNSNYLHSAQAPHQYQLLPPALEPDRIMMHVPAAPKLPVIKRRSHTLTFCRNLTEREQFLIFVKILFKFLDADQNLRQRAKAIVSECTRRNRLGDTEFSPLQEAVERRLRLIVGDIYWTRAILYMDHYCRQRGLETAVAV